MFPRTRALIAILAVLLAGCSSAGAAIPATPTPTLAPTPVPTATPEPTPAGILQSYEQCKAVVQPEIDVIGEISSRLVAAGGINIKDYQPLVDSIPLGSMDRLAGGSNRFCRNVAVQDAATASLDHIQASAAWSNCLSFPTVDVQPCIDTIVQRWWTKGSNDYDQLLTDMTNLSRGLVPPVDPDPIYDQQAAKVTHTPVELANMACDKQYGEAVSDLFELGRVLAEGTSLKAYGAWVKATSDDVAKVDSNSLDGTCLISVGATVKTILNDHIDARDAWRACGKLKSQAKYDSCTSKTVQPIWGGRLTADYARLFDALGTLYFNQVTLLRPSFIPHATP
jgi:hypothetical protein